MKITNLSCLTLAGACAVFVGLSSTAMAAECQRQLNLLRPNAPEARKLDALLTCAGETRSDLAALGVRVSDLERTTARHERQLEDRAGLTTRVGEIERTVAQQGRTLEGLDGRIDRAVTAAVRNLETALKTDIRNLRNELRTMDTGTADLARLTRKLDQLSGRKWEEFGGAQRPIGRSRNNDKDYPIIVSATINVGDSNRCHARIKVNGVTVSETKNNNDSWDKACFVTATVPPAASYVVESAPHGGGRPRVSRWAELR